MSTRATATRAVRKARRLRGASRRLTEKSYALCLSAKRTLERCRALTADNQPSDDDPLLRFIEARSRIAEVDELDQELADLRERLSQLRAICEIDAICAGADIAGTEIDL